MNHIKVILNPFAGKGAAGRSLAHIKDLLDAAQLDYDLVQTQAPGHAIELARRAAADGFDVVAAVGGDGTINEVINGLMQFKTETGKTAAIGALPEGRGNDFCFGMGLPTLLEPAVQALKHGSRRLVDIGRATGGFYPQGRYFGNGVGIGFDAVVGFEAAKMKDMAGFLGYAVAAVKTISLYHHPPVLSVEMDGREISQACLMVSVMNGRRMGGGFMMAPTSKSQDGLFDLCIAGQTSQLGIMALIPRFMKGTQAGHPVVRMEQAQRVVVKAVTGSIPAHADGETLCTEGQQLVLEILPGQLELVG